MELEKAKHNRKLKFIFSSLSLLLEREIILSEKENMNIKKLTCGTNKRGKNLQFQKVLSTIVKI